MSPSVLRHLPCTALLLALAGCNSGNLKTASAYSSPPHAPPVRAPLYDPYAMPGQVPATWMPPVYDREGTIIRPHDPSVEWDLGVIRKQTNRIACDCPARGFPLLERFVMPFG